MQFGVGVEYAIHSLFYLIGLPQGRIVGIKELAKLNGLADAYLSKILSNLRKGGVVRSVPGAGGGYELSRAPEDISFWDVVAAVEGSSFAFQCAEIRCSGALASGDTKCDTKAPCLIRVVMEEAEERMRDYLRSKSLAWLYQTAKDGFSDDAVKTLSSWVTSGKIPHRDETQVQ